MNDDKRDIEMALRGDSDRRESVAMMDPLLISEGSGKRTDLIDLTLELTHRSAALNNSLPTGVMTALADLVRAMNCYYSNLIEGHDTHPVDIERALNNDYSADPEKRDLQLEAKAHISVQKWIDEGGLDGAALTTNGIREIHRQFCTKLPDALLWLTLERTDERMRVVPGEYRKWDVQVGRRARQPRCSAALHGAL